MPSLLSRRGQRRTLNRRRLLLESLEYRRVLATYFVNSTEDNAQARCVADQQTGNDACTLRAAIGFAEQTTDADTIQIAPGTYFVESFNGPFSVSGQGGDLRLRRDQAATAPVIIDGRNVVQLFDLGIQPKTYRFENLTLQNGRAAGNNGGGAIGAAGPINLIIDSVSFLNNDAIAGSASSGAIPSGGAIDIDGNLTISNSIFRNNSAARNGGAIAFSIEPGLGALSNMSITNTIFEANRAGTNANDTSQGGAIWTQGIDSRVNIADATFTTNTAGDSGGAIYADQASVVINSSSFTGNSATGSDSGGGAVYVLGDPNSATQPTFSITGGSFTGNSAVAGGGGLESVEASGTITGTTFTTNQVTGQSTAIERGGGAMVLISSNDTPDPIRLENVTLSENRAPNAGGIAAVDVALTVVNSTISQNEATASSGGGGGIAAASVQESAALVIENSRITGNISAGEAGGVGAVDTNVSITGSTIDANRANAGRGGGIGITKIQATTDRTLTLNAATVSNNVSSGDGGGLALEGTRISAINTTISANESTAGGGGGLSYRNDSNSALPSTIQFTTFANNRATNSGTNIAAVGQPIQVGSSIFAGGDASYGMTYDPISLGNNVDSGNTLGFNQPTDLNNTDPQLGPLQDNDGPVFTHALLIGSPAIDSADAGAITVDARGIPRPQDGDGDTIARADRGAYEGETVTRGVVKIDDFNVNEGVSALLTLRLTGSVAGGFSFTAATQNGTAIAGVDYDALNNIVNFLGTDGETQTLTITTIDDAQVEANEFFTLLLSNPSSILVTVDDTATITIIDNDVAPASADVDISAIVQAGDEIIAGEPFTYEVSVSNLGGDSAQQVSVTAPFPAGTSFVSFDPAGTQVTSAVNAAGLNVDVGALSMGQIVTFRYDVLVDPAASGTITNVTTVSSTTNDPVPANNSSVVNSLIQPRALLTGHVFCDANRSGAEEAGEMLANVRVFVDGNGNRRFDTNELETTTDSLGDYRFATLPQGSYVLVAEIPSTCGSIPSNPGVIQSLVDVGYLARSIRAVDRDGDGDEDLVIASDLDGVLHTLINQSGDLVVGAKIELGPRLQRIAVPKPSSDSSMMAVVGIGDGGTEAAGRLYYGTNSFEAVQTGDGPIDVLVDDFVSGGGDEILTAAFRSSTLQLFSPSGAFATREIETTTSHLYSIASGDVDGDGDIDIVAGGYGYDPDLQSASTVTQDSEINVLINDGSGNFSPASIAPSLRGKFATIRVTDIDGDNQAEILAISRATSGLASSLNMYRFSGGVMGLISSLSIPAKASAMDFGDLNNDGVIDVVVASETENRVVFYVGSNEGTFRQIQTVENIPSPIDLTLVDLEGDGRSEVAVANLYRRQIDPTDTSPFLPSTVTLLRLQVAQNGVLVEQTPVSSDFSFPTALLRTRMDVNADSLITAGDAIQVINGLRLQSATLTAGLPEDEAVSRLWKATDVNLDGATTSFDALLIINELMRTSPTQSAAQAEWLPITVIDNSDDSIREHQVDEILAGGLF